MTTSRLGIIGVLALAVCVIAICGVRAMAPQEYWSRTYGGSLCDAGYSVQQTTDGGFVIVGHTSSGGVKAVWLIKTDSRGRQEWLRTFGSHGHAIGHSVQQTSDGGYIVVGQVTSLGVEESDAWLIKTDSAGDQQWSKVIGGLRRDVAYSVQQTSDGGYIFTGYSGSYGTSGNQLWLGKVDSDGHKEWSKTFGGDEGWGAFEGCGKEVRETLDGGYIVVGSKYEDGPGDVWLMKTDSAGNTSWERSFGGDREDIGESVCQTSDGGYLVVGHTKSYGTGSPANNDVFLIRVASNGMLMWSKNVGGDGDDVGYSVQQTSDGGYVVVGATDSFGAGSHDVWLIKIDSDGDQVCDETFGGRLSDVGYSVQQIAEDDYIVVGSTCSYGAGDSDLLLVKASMRNESPMAKAGGPYVGNEGSAIHFDASDSFDPDGDSLEYRWDLNDDGVWDTQWSTDPTASYVWNDDWNGTAIVEVGDGEVVCSDSSSVIVVDVFPIVTATNDGPVGEGRVVTVTASVIDPGQDTHTYFFDWDNDGDYDMELPMPYAPNIWYEDGTYTVGVKVEDEDGIKGFATTNVTITDVGPVAAVSGDISVDEAAVGNYDAADSISYPDAITKYEWDWDYDGVTFRASGDEGHTQSHAWMDDGDYIVALRVTDEDRSVGISTMAVTVTDLSPSAGFVWTPCEGPVGEGSPLTFMDNSTSFPDGIASWSWNFGDGTVGCGQETIHSYEDDGTYTVSLAIVDEDGDQDTVCHDVVIVNVPPTVEAEL